METKHVAILIFDASPKFLATSRARSKFFRARRLGLPAPESRRSEDSAPFQVFTVAKDRGLDSRRRRSRRFSSQIFFRRRAAGRHRRHYPAAGERARFSRHRNAYASRDRLESLTRKGLNPQCCIAADCARKFSRSGLA